MKNKIIGWMLLSSPLIAVLVLLCVVYGVLITISATVAAVLCASAIFGGAHLISIPSVRKDRVSFWKGIEYWFKTFSK